MLLSASPGGLVPGRGWGLAGVRPRGLAGEDGRPARGWGWHGEGRMDLCGLLLALTRLPQERLLSASAGLFGHYAAVAYLPCDNNNNILYSSQRFNPGCSS